jgi:WD40-like Beta Propeller Repeat
MQLARPRTIGQFATNCHIDSRGSRDMFSSRVSALGLQSVLRPVALALLATTLLVGCGSRRAAAHKAPLRWSDLFPAWSPNGRLITFSSDRPAHKQRDLYVVKVDGSHLRRLTNDELNELYPVFVSNRQIAFMVRGKRYVIAADERGQRLMQRRRVRSRARSSTDRGWVALDRPRVGRV